MRTRPCLEYEGRIGHGYSNNYNYNDNNSPGAGLCAGRSRLRAAVRCGRGQAGGCSGGQLQLSRGWGGRALALPLEAMPVSWRSASLGKLQQHNNPDRGPRILWRVRPLTNTGGNVSTTLIVLEDESDEVSRSSQHAGCCWPQCAGYYPRLIWIGEEFLTFWSTLSIVWITSLLFLSAASASVIAALSNAPHQLSPASHSVL